MATLTIRNVSMALEERVRAAGYGHSMEDRCGNFETTLPETEEFAAGKSG